jgi:hypothetical protein
MTNTVKHTDWDSLIKTVDSAKDEMGVVRPEALQRQLASLTPDDWRTLSTRIYPKRDSDPNGFYIVDENDKNIVIHNDLKKADTVAHQSFLKGVWEETKRDGAAMLSLGMDGAVAGFTSGALTGSFITEALISGTSDAFIMGGLIGGGAVAALLGGGAIGLIAYTGSTDRKQAAVKDLNDSQSVRMALQSAG